MATLIDYPTFSDSPFFFDRRNLHIAQPEAALLQVCLLTFNIQYTRELTAGTLGTERRVLLSQGCWKLPLRGMSLNARIYAQALADTYRRGIRCAHIALS